jgi:hypothetical protein
LAQPTTLGVADTFGIELRDPSNHRWIVGAKLSFVVNQYGLVVAWAYAAVNVADNAFGALVADVADEMVVVTDMAFHTHHG